MVYAKGWKLEIEFGFLEFSIHYDSFTINFSVCLGLPGPSIYSQMMCWEGVGRLIASTKAWLPA